MEWIKLNHETKENHPPNEKVVLVAIRNGYNGKLMKGQAYYVGYKTKTDDRYNEYELELEYDEDKDAYYWPEGWYDSSYEGEVDWLLSDKVEYWMKWPELPVEE